MRQPPILFLDIVEKMHVIKEAAEKGCLKR